MSKQKITYISYHDAPKKYVPEPGPASDYYCFTKYYGKFDSVKAIELNDHTFTIVLKRDRKQEYMLRALMNSTCTWDNYQGVTYKIVYTYGK